MARASVLLLILGAIFSSVLAIRRQRSDASFDVLEANQTLHLAWTAYCNESAIKAWTCQWCDGPSLQLQTYLKDTKAGTQGYVAIDHLQRRVVVAYRGSKSFQNTVQDAEFWMTKLPFGPESLKLEVDHGFLEAYQSVRSATTANIKAALGVCGDDCSVLFTGHSLGAAMATIGAVEFASNSSSVTVQLYNFGSPRVGNKAFAVWAHSQLNSSASVRMRRQKDIVPAIPPRSIGYVHIPTEVWDKHLDNKGKAAKDTFLVCNGSGEDPDCGDSEEHPPFPLDLIGMDPAEHTRYMGFEGGNCWCGTSNCE